MRFIHLMFCLLAVAGCTRPTSGLSLADATRAASNGVREYFNWVANDPVTFPNRLCLATILFETKLSDTKSNSVSAALPLAAPSAGLTGLLGFDWSSTADDVGKVTVPMYARYRKQARTKAEYGNEFEDFLTRIPSLRTQLEVENRKGGDLRLPPGMDRKSFKGRTDLAAELWTIREAIHEMVLNSSDGIIFDPGVTEVFQEFRITTDANGSASVTLANKVGGTLGAGRKATDHNRMGIFFALNRSKDQMRCDATSIPEEVAEGFELRKSALN